MEGPVSQSQQISRYCKSKEKRCCRSLVRDTTDEACVRQKNGDSLGYREGSFEEGGLASKMSSARNFSGPLDSDVSPLSYMSR